MESKWVVDDSCNQISSIEPILEQCHYSGQKMVFFYSWSSIQFEPSWDTVCIWKLKSLNNNQTDKQ